MAFRFTVYRASSSRTALWYAHVWRDANGFSTAGRFMNGRRRTVTLPFARGWRSPPVGLICAAAQPGGDVWNAPRGFLEPRSSTNRRTRELREETGLRVPHSSNSRVSRQTRTAPLDTASPRVSAVQVSRHNLSELRASRLSCDSDEAACRARRSRSAVRASSDGSSVAAWRPLYQRCRVARLLAYLEAQDGSP